MGLLDLLRPKRTARSTTKSALEAAEDPTADDGAVNRLIQMILNVGLDGSGPIDSAVQIAEEARRESRTAEDAVRKIARSHTLTGAAGGFLTSVGGFVTMPVALPLNVFEFYVQATRMVGAIATLRGYDVSQPQIRTAVLLTMVGSNADDILKKAGLTTGSGRIAAYALRGMPPAALLMVNKAIGFRLLRGMGSKALSRFGRGIPLAGGAVGAGVDGWMMKRIADQAMKEFPVVPPGAPTTGGAPQK